MKASLLTTALLGLLLIGGTSRAERWAVVVGNDLGRNNEVPLRYAESDAKRMGALLTEIGSVESHRLQVLLGRDATALEAALARVQAEIAQHGAESMLLFYYSGHADGAALHLGESSLEIQRVKELLEASRASVRIGILDACGTGAALQRDKGLERTEPFLLTAPRELSARGQVMLAAVSGSEAAQESDSLKSSFFTAALMTGLRGAADRRGTGRVTLDQAYRYAYAQTVRSTLLSRSGAQHPSYEVDLAGQGDVVITEPGLGTTRLVFEADEAGEFALFGKDETLLALFRLDAGGRARLALPAGRFEVHKRSASGLKIANVALTSGDERTLQEARMPKVELIPLARKGLTPRAHLSVGATFGMMVGPDPMATTRLAADFDWGRLTLAPRATFAASSWQRAANRPLVRETALRLGAALLYGSEGARFGWSLGGGVDAAFLWQSAYGWTDTSRALVPFAHFGGTLRLQGGLSALAQIEPGLFLTEAPKDQLYLRTHLTTLIGARYEF